jgi:hypothetical protein
MGFTWSMDEAHTNSNLMLTLWYITKSELQGFTPDLLSTWHFVKEALIFCQRSILLSLSYCYMPWDDFLYLTRPKFLKSFTYLLIQWNVIAGFYQCLETQINKHSQWEELFNCFKSFQKHVDSASQRFNSIKNVFAFVSLTLLWIELKCPF